MTILPKLPAISKTRSSSLPTIATLRLVATDASSTCCKRIKLEATQAQR